MNENTYFKFLQEANLVESTNLEKTLNYLYECVQFLEENPDLIKNSAKNKKLLKTRILYLETKLSSNMSSNSLSNENEEVISPNEINKEKKPKETVKIKEETEIKDKSEIVDDIYSKLKKKEKITYNDYLLFYSYLNEQLAKKSVPIVRDGGNLAYFIGDTHGSYEESLIILSYFDKVLEKNPKVKIIFDGDYVDRNLYDLENLTLITAFFLLHPNNVVMLRGNHEDQKINKYYGFYRNLKDYFIIQDRVDEIYGKILNFFMNLPVIHILNIPSKKSTIKRIITVHGGIPVDTKNPSTPVILNDLEKKIKWMVPSYEQFDEYMSWLLWADPKENIKEIKLNPETGRNFYGKAVFENFMKENNLDLLVRAHEVLEDGYKFFFKKKLISLFSTSYYKNRKIGNGAILKIREVNGSITDPMFLSINEKILNQDLKENF